MATIKARSSPRMAVNPSIPAYPGPSSALRQGVDLWVAQIAWHDGDWNRKRTHHFGQRGDDRAGALGTGVGRQNQHGDIDVLLDHVENLFGRVALANNPFRGDRGDAVGASGGAV